MMPRPEARHLAEIKKRFLTFLLSLLTFLWHTDTEFSYRLQYFCYCLMTEILNCDQVFERTSHKISDSNDLDFLKSIHNANTEVQLGESSIKWVYF